jgi:hypothetical protein
MKQIALSLAVLASACASSYAPDPADPVDMAAELGNRARAYVGMGEVCDTATGGAHRAAIVQIVQTDQERLGVLADLVNRAYRGRATEELMGHMRAQMTSHGLSAEQFCTEVVAQAEAELDARTTDVLALPTYHDIMYYVREGQRPNT